jgi:Holliday junction DNA helicase RuvA
MIGRLKGIVEKINEDSVLLDVGGVGYNIFCSANTLRSIGGEGEAAKLEIETHVREDHIHLYGFASEAEKTWFLTLTKVSGVGARIALAILSVLSSDQLYGAIISQDKAAFKQVSGVGPKLAERIIVELKNKNTLPQSDDNIISINGEKPKESGVINDAVSALTNLGYGRSEAFTAVTKILNEKPETSLQNLIREGLKNLSKNVA